MTRRLFLLGGVVITAVLLARSGAAQYPNIPPTRVPQTAEPGLADPQNLPKRLPVDMERLGNQPRLGSPGPVRPAGVEELQPASNDPPVPAVAIRVRDHMPQRLQVSYTLDEIAKIGNHFRRATGEVNRWNLRLCQPIDDSINCLARHDLFALRPGVHMAMQAGEVAKLAHINLENLGPPTPQRD